MVRVAGKERAVARAEFQQRHGWLCEEIDVISSARKCILPWRISMFGAFEQQGA